jgi:hypothetical protein
MAPDPQGARGPRPLAPRTRPRAARLYVEAAAARADCVRGPARARWCGRRSGAARRRCRASRRCALATARWPTRSSRRRCGASCARCCARRSRTRPAPLPMGRSSQTPSSTARCTSSASPQPRQTQMPQAGRVEERRGRSLARCATCAPTPAAPPPPILLSPPQLPVERRGSRFDRAGLTAVKPRAAAAWRALALTRAGGRQAPGDAGDASSSAIEMLARMAEGAGTGGNASCRFQAEVAPTLPWTQGGRAGGRALLRRAAG